MYERALFYLNNGTRLVILVFPGKRQVEALTHEDHVTLNESDTLDGGDVLPGFTMAVKDAFRGV